MEINTAVVAIWGSAGYGPKRFCGTGYLLTPRIVLTAEHVVGHLKADRALKVHVCRLHENLDQARTASLAWHATDEFTARGTGTDAALLRLDRPVPEAVSPPRFGRLIFSGSVLPGVATGFLGLQRVYGLPETEPLTGVIKAAGGLRGGTLYFDLDGPVAAWPVAGPARHDTPWRGVSGSALFCLDRIVGVVVASPESFGQRRLQAVPVSAFYEDPDFRKQLGIAPIIEAVEFPAAQNQWQPHSPAHLLEARSRIVRFTGRRTELSELSDWCGPTHHGGEPVSSDPARGDGGLKIRALHGSGGQGKSRIAAHLADHLARYHDWSVAYLHDNDPLPKTIKEPVAPILLVIDYAEAQRERLSALLNVVHHQSLRKPVRALLLTRSLGEWWDELQDVHRNQQPIPDWASDQEIPALYGDHDAHDRAAEFNRAVNDLRQALNLLRNFHNARLTGWTWTDPGTITPPADLYDPRYACVLRIHMAALAALLSGGHTPSAPVEKTLLGHEAKYWRATADHHKVTIENDTRQACVAIAALCGAATQAQAETTLEVVPGLEHTSRSERTKLAAWVRALYPPVHGDASYWGSLQPDILAEYLVSDVISVHPWLLGKLLRSTQPGQVRHLLGVLCRAAIKQPSLHALIEQLPTQHPHLAEAIVGTVPEVDNPTPLLTGLSRLINSMSPDDGALLQRINRALPERSALLMHIAVSVSKGLVQYLQFAFDSPDTVDLAIALQDLAIRLAAVGDHTAALQTAVRAESMYRRLARANSNLLSGHAMTQNTLANRYADLGQFDKALRMAKKALRAYEKIAAKATAHQEELAMAHHNLSLRHTDTGDHRAAIDAAIKASEIYRTLASGPEPDDNLNAQYAATLNNLARLHTVLERYERALPPARHALHLCEKLVLSRPDAHLPELAESQLTVGEILVVTGETEAGLGYLLQARTTWMKLASSNPGKFGLGLARTCELIARLRSTTNDTVGVVETAALAIQHARGRSDELTVAATKHLYKAYQEAAPLVAVVYEKITGRPWPPD